MKRSIHLISCLLIIPLLSGCMGYQLGGTRPEGIKTVYMAPVVNKTHEPAIELQATKALRQRLQMDGRLELLDAPENADAVMEVVLDGYSLTAIAFNSDLRTTAEQYRLRIDATATLKSTKTGDTVSKSTTYGEATFHFQSDLTTSKRDALPAATEELAKFIVDDLAERW